MNIWAGLISTAPRRRTRDNTDISQDVIDALEAQPINELVKWLEEREPKGVPA